MTVGVYGSLGRSSAVVKDERGELHPFAVECAARQIPSVCRAALVGRNKRRILFVEPKEGVPLDIAALRGTLAWAQLDEVRKISQIPLDRRHNAKVDYGRLAKIT